MQIVSNRSSFRYPIALQFCPLMKKAGAAHDHVNLEFMLTIYISQKGKNMKSTLVWKCNPERANRCSRLPPDYICNQEVSYK